LALEMKFTIPLPPRTKKNSSQMFKNFKTGKLYPAPSKAFLKYQTDAGWYIPHKGEKISKKVNVKCLFYTEIDYDNTNGIIDLVGLLQAIDDILVHYGVLKDDNCRIIAGHDGSAVMHDGTARTEITITEVTR